jgi:hypothetical protein
MRTNKLLYQHKPTTRKMYMAKFSISFARFKINADGKKGGVTSTSKRVEAPSAEVAMAMIQSQYPEYFIEFRNIKEVK